MNDDKAQEYAKARLLALQSDSVNMMQREIEAAYRAGHAQGVADANRKCWHGENDGPIKPEHIEALRGNSGL